MYTHPVAGNVSPVSDVPEYSMVRVSFWNTWLFSPQSGPSTLKNLSFDDLISISSMSKTRVANGGMLSPVKSNDAHYFRFLEFRIVR